MQNVYSQELLQRVSDLVGQKMKAYHITGAGVSIVDGGDTVYCQGFGLADKVNNVPVTGDTIFKIGSITKLFTASAIMQLSEQGKIDIDKPVKEYIEEFSVKTRFQNTRPITVRDLLCHHSGLPCDDMSDYFSSDPEAYKSVVEYLKDAYTISPPGKMFYYSNLGVDLLGVIIERATKIPYHKYIEDVLLKGLNMDKSAIVLSEELKKYLSKPYSKDKEQVECLMKEVPPGGIYSTALDMAKFMKSVLNGGKGLFAKESTLNEMFIPQYPDNPIDFNMNNGIGWFAGKPGLNHAGKVVWHDGGTPNYFSLTVLCPDYKLGITLLTNSSTGALMNHQVSVDIMRLLLEAKYDIKPPVEEGRERVELTPEMIKKASGRFVTLSGIAEVSASGKKLTARMPSGTFLMHPCKDGWFSVSLLLLGIIPLKLKQLSLIRMGVQEIDGEKILAMEQLGFRSPIGREYKPLNATKAWKDRVGEYTCFSEENPRIKNFKLKCSPDGMAISVSADKMGRLNLHLDIIDDSKAIIAGCGRYSGETIFASDEGISFLGLKFRRDK